MHAITANKGPVVHGYQALSEIARSNGSRFLFESTVMDGAPIFSTWREGMPGARLMSFRGILNSTTNFLLSEMEGGKSFESALAEAQAIGVAETDPSGDIDGWDAAVKVAALATVLMDYPLGIQEVDRQGIGELDADQISAAKEDGQRWKLICSVWREKNVVRGRVRPERVGPEDPLYHVRGTSSQITFSSDVLGDLTIMGTDPGPDTTAYGMFADLLNAIRTSSN
jgi:homoserine dehydrogenase